METCQSPVDEYAGEDPVLILCGEPAVYETKYGQLVCEECARFYGAPVKRIKEDRAG